MLLQIFQLVQQKGGKIAGRDLAPLLHLYTARLALACHNRKAAKKEVSACPCCWSCCIQLHQLCTWAPRRLSTAPLSSTNSFQVNDVACQGTESVYVAYST